MVDAVVNQPQAANNQWSDQMRKDNGVLFDPSNLVDSSGKVKRYQEQFSNFKIDPDGNIVYTQPEKIINYSPSLTDHELIVQHNTVPLQEDWDTLTDPEAKIESYRDLIEQHLETRIQLAFMQMVSCYDVPLHFEAEGAEDQIGVGKNVKIIDPTNPNNTEIIHTQAAHSSTFPCLYAHPRNPDGTYDANQKFVYLKYSGSYMDHNSTIMLPREVNQTDTYMDGKSGETRLRNYTLGRLNALSKRQTTVQEAMKGFIRKIIRETSEDRIKPTIYEKKAGVFQIYHDCAVEILGAMEEQGDEYFDRLLGVNLEGSEEENILRRIVFQKRFEMIKSAQRTESAMMKAILDTQNAINGTQANHFKGVDFLLKFALLKDADEDQEKILAKLFCSSVENLRANIATKLNLRRYEISKVDSYLDANRAEIKSLKRTLRKHSRELIRSELTFRSGFFRSLRTDYKNWYQREFVAKYKELYPGFSMNVPKVSKMEQRSRPPRDFNYVTPVKQRRVDISIPEARRCAATFGVEAGLFLPGVLTSNY